MELIKYSAPVEIEGVHDCLRKQEEEERDLFALVTPNKVLTKEQILELYFPPIYNFEFNTMRHVAKRTSCSDLQNLERDLTDMLKARVARQRPLCGVRASVLQGTALELVRQLMIENDVQGQLLLRTLGHYFKEIHALEKLLESTEAFTDRVLIQNYFEFYKQMQYKKTLDQETLNLQEEIGFLNDKFNKMMATFEAYETAAKNKNTKQKQFYITANEQLKSVVTNTSMLERFFGL
ncbi:hypothetical protein Ciccas_006633 [Cichlidogyrus casuarinus]|uniref:Uncharacterized protein n=1 Tax=Cichlidogyrus casuarinus TaxID=1844966 RepID=A0ABD2Q5S7_9PLAT